MTAPARVLLVDDEPLALTTLAPLLADRYTVETAEGGDLARQLMDDRPCDVVIADERMPGTRGSELLHWVREHHPSAVRIMLTAYDDPEIMRRAINDGRVHRFHLKPVSPPQLRSDIEALLEERSLASENQRLVEELRNSEARYRELFEGANDLVFLHDFTGRIIDCNHAAERVTGYDRETMLGMTAFDLVSEEHGATAREMVQRKLRGEVTETRYEVEILCQDGRRVPVEISTRLIYEGDQPTGVQGIGRDISERRRAERALAEQVKHDPLTGLLNRRGLEEELFHAAQGAWTEDTRTVAALVDCDNFKRVNDTLGYAVGDVALVEIARKLRDAVRETDVVARIGGDEFLLLLRGTRVSEGLLVAERARLAVTDTPIVVQDREIPLTASIGVAVVDGSVASLEELLAETHVGLARSKKAGKNRVSFSDPTESGDRSLDPVVECIRSGRGLTSLAQPIVSLVDGSRHGTEFLARGPEGPFSAPDALFKLAYEQKVLTPLDLRCLRMALDAATRVGHADAVHVNLFPSTLIDTRAERLAELLVERVDPQRVCLELSEQQLIGDPSRLAEAVTPLKEIGVRIALDDVGFGRSSLESLIALEPHIVKIDRRYVAGVSADANRRRCIERLLRILERLDITAIAEGLESEAEVRCIAELGVPYGQGYGLGRPEAID